MTIVELLPPIGIGFLSASMLLPALGKAKKKGNRVKCMNNLGQITKAWNGFAAEEQNGEVPWMMTQRSLNAVYDDKPKGNNGATWGRGVWWHARNIEHMWSPVGRDLGTVRTLLSPCDPGTKASNQETFAREIDTKRSDATGAFAGNNKVENHAQSYAVHKGASAQAPNTIIAMTRNFTGADSGGPGGKWNAEIIPTQPYDRDEDGTFDPIASGSNWGQMARGGEAIYYRNDDLARRNRLHPVVYTSIARAPDWDGWDRYLCLGHADTLRHDKNGNGVFDVDDGDIKANGFIGPNVDPSATYQRTGEKLNIHGSLAMMGLRYNQGQVARSDGSVSQANDSDLKEAIHVHARDRTSNIHALEVISQPTRQVRP